MTKWRTTFPSIFSAAAMILFSFACGCATNAAPKKTATKAAAAKAPLPLAADTFDAVWNSIYENHFDTNFNGHDWIAVRKEYRPRALAATSRKQLRDTIQEMLDLLHVSHLAIVPGDTAEENTANGRPNSPALEPASEEDQGTIGIDVRFLGKNLLVTRVASDSPAARAGVRPGWILRRIDDTATSTLFGRTPKALDLQRRKFLAWRAASKRLSGRVGSEVHLEFLDDKNHATKLTLARQGPPGQAVRFGNLPVLYANLQSREIDAPHNTRIGLIRFNIWMLPTALAFNRAIDEFRSCAGIIIDLRGNVGGLVGMIIGVAGHFMDEPVSLGDIVSRDNTLHLPANPRRVDTHGNAVEPFSGPVAILVDEITASASEVFTGGLQELGRVRVFGRVTSGQALPAVYDELPNGDALYHPVADFVTGKGTRFEGRGVIPDEKVPLNRNALLAGQDRALERAIHWIASKPPSWKKRSVNGSSPKLPVQ
jgi:carboxyl-terminal processing protease